MALSSVPEGLIVPLHTPFLPDGSVHYAGLESEMDLLERAGIRWILAVGTTGEWPSLTLGERQRIVETLAAARRRMKLLVNTSTFRFEEVVELTQHAERNGGDAIMVCGPFVYGMPQADIRSYYVEIARRTSLPIVVYNNPGSIATRIEPATIAELSRIPNVVGLKDSSRSAREANDVRAAAVPGFKVLAGEGDLFMSSLGAGAEGGIIVPSLIFPGYCLKVYEDFRSGNVTRAIASWYRLWPLITVLGGGGRYFPMMKLALEYLQRPAGRCRPPLAQTVDEGAEKRLREVLDELRAR